MISCRMCNDGRLFKQLGTHLKCIHNVTGEEYKKRYGVDDLCCKSLRKVKSEILKGNKIGVGNKSRTGYKMTKEHKEILRKVNMGNDYGAGHTQTEENKEKARIRINKTRKDGKITEEICCKNGNVKWYKIRNHKDNIEKVHGSFEKRVGRALTKLGIRWKKTKKWFEYKLHGKVKEYNPDFWLRDDKYYLEMKNYIDQNNFGMIMAKQKMMIKRGKRKGFQYEIMFDIDIKKLEKEVG